jgi:hypothetical protein
MTARPNATAKTLKPPAGLSKRESELWQLTVRSFPADWFRSSDGPLLIELVRALSQADALAERIAKTTELSELKVLLDLRDREARRAAAISTKLRLPPQSRSDRHAAGTAARPGGSRPWDYPDILEDDDDEKFFGR